MCGIAGIVEFHGKQASADLLSLLCAKLAHRGPDGEGHWYSRDKSVALGHRRLAILDLESRADQPMVSTDGRHVLIFNGEIYNFLELRRELTGSGEVFRTEADTEVVLAAWRRWGEEMLTRFNGMWALALYDVVDNTLFLARDRFGIKPLLYALDDERLIFASELGALTAASPKHARPDENVIRRVLIDPFGVEGSESTLFRGIRRLPAGHYMVVRNGHATSRRWWCTAENLPEIPQSDEERVRHFSELFREAVAIRMRSDVPIGTSLSGGFDSSAVLCAMAACDRDGTGPRGAKGWRHAFVASFPGLDNDERPHAELAAHWAGVVPTILNFGADDALAHVDQVLESLDDIHIGLPTAVWRLYRAMRAAGVRVSLDGHGADELMGAYRQSRQSAAFWLRNWVAAFTPGGTWRAALTDRARLGFLRRQQYLFVRGRMAGLPPPLPVVAEADSLPDNWAGLNRRLYRMFHGTVLPTILRNFDRLSMAHGVEVRMPFMDWRLVTYTMALPEANKSGNGFTKLIARQAMEGAMPEEIRMQMRKVGFNSPMPVWLNGPLRPWIERLLAARVPLFEELVDEAALGRRVLALQEARGWNWESAGRLWPYLHVKWLLARLDAAV